MTCIINPEYNNVPEQVQENKVSIKSCLKYCGDWVTSSVYNFNDLVEYGTKTYRCKVGTVKGSVTPPDADTVSWAVFVDNSSTPAPASGMNFMGEWVANNEYHVDDVVVWNINSYVCKRAHTSQTNPYADTTNWTPLANSGGIIQNVYNIASPINIPANSPLVQSVEIPYDYNPNVFHKIVHVGINGPQEVLWNYNITYLPDGRTTLDFVFYNHGPNDMSISTVYIYIITPSAQMTP